tara:strand:+ start:222 stop:779 length:558 start_codon:yes stop_codon:yes gene_type:complete
MKSARYDITNALIHLTGDRKAEGGISAEDALCEILKNKEIRGSSTPGYIRSGHTAACLTEMPLKAIDIFITEHKGKKKFSNHGIAMHKQTGWQCGARPVIYLPEAEAQWIPAEQKWRHVTYDLGSIDWTHEREWRALDRLNFSDHPFYIIVPNSETEHRIRATVGNEGLKNAVGFLHLNYLLDIL